MKNTTGTPSVAQENQAIKRQKLEGGKSRQVAFYVPPFVGRVSFSSIFFFFCF